MRLELTHVGKFVESYIYIYIYHMNEYLAEAFSFSISDEMGAVIFSHLNVIMPGVQLSVFCTPSNGFSISVSSKQSESIANLQLIYFYSCLLLSQPRLFHSFLLPCSSSLSLSLCLPWLSFSYMILSFPPSHSWPVNLARKQLTINQSP